MTLCLNAPAKINLSLRVGPPQPDGRHPLDSLVAFTKGVGDTLTLAPSDRLSLEIIGPFGASLSVTDDNLVLRAAALLRETLDNVQGADIVLDKRLPIASGIGGGSADAAAALKGLNRLWGAGLSDNALADLGASLGADVPACVLSKPARMTGTGETIWPLAPLPGLGIVLVNPLQTCPTGSVYQRYDARGAIEALDDRPLPAFATADDVLSYLRATPNDLEAAACDLVPDIAAMLAVIAQSPGVLLARMSGSGATCFGLYQNGTKAIVAAEAIRKTLAKSPVWVEADEIA